MSEHKYLGLNPAHPRTWNGVEIPYADESPLVRFLGIPAYIPEARATFEALVPDRYKVKASEK